MEFDDSEDRQAVLTDDPDPALSDLDASPESSFNALSGSGTLAEMVKRNLRAAPPGALDLVDAEVVLHDNAGDACTIVLRRGEMTVRPGRPRRLTATTPPGSLLVAT